MADRIRTDTDRLRHRCADGCGADRDADKQLQYSNPVAGSTNHRTDDYLNQYARARGFTITGAVHSDRSGLGHGGAQRTFHGRG